MTTSQNSFDPPSLSRVYRSSINSTHKRWNQNSNKNNSDNNSSTSNTQQSSNRDFYHPFGYNFFPSSMENNQNNQLCFPSQPNSIQTSQHNSVQNNKLSSSSQLNSDPNTRVSTNTNSNKHTSSSIYQEYKFQLFDSKPIIYQSIKPTPNFRKTSTSSTFSHTYWSCISEATKQNSKY